MYNKLFRLAPRFSSKTYYTILEVPLNSSFNQIKTNYLEQSKRWHPDSQDGDTHKFLQIQRAYKILSDPIQRRKYDQQMGLESSQWEESEYGLKDSNFKNEDYEKILGSDIKVQKFNSMEESLMHRFQKQLAEKPSPSQYAKGLFLPVLCFSAFYIVWQTVFIYLTSGRETETYAAKQSQTGKSFSVLVIETR